jgi:hypothetical protein
MSTYEAAGVPAGADTPPEAAFLTSASVICPPVPVPLIPESLTPVSTARFTAAALALRTLSIAGCNLPPLGPVSSGTGAGSAAGEGCAFDGSGLLASSFGGAGAAFCPPASSIVKSSKAEISSPSSTMTAMGCDYLATCR